MLRRILRVLYDYLLQGVSMKIVKLFLPLALLCSLSAQQTYCMSEENSEYIWVKDHTFPAPQGSKKTKSRWIAVPAQKDLVHSRLQESVSLGELSHDEYTSAQQDIEKALQQTYVLTAQEKIAFDGKYIPAAYQAAVIAARKHEQRAQTPWTQLSETQPNSSDTQAQSANIKHALTPAAVINLEHMQEQKQKALFLAMLASEETHRIITLEEEIAHLKPEYARFYKTVDQVEKEKKARDAQSRTSWWSLFSRSAK